MSPLLLASGQSLEFRFDDKGYNAMKVLELTPGKRVRWQYVDSAREWIGSELTKVP